MLLYVFLFVFFVFLGLRIKNALKYSNYPSGPLTLPIVGSVFSLGAKPHEKLSQLKSKYGNIIAIDFGSRRGIVLNDFETIKNAFNLKEVQSRPDSEILKLVRGPNLAGIGFSSGKANEEQRAFTLKTLKNFGVGKKSIESLLVEEIQILFETFDANLGAPVLNDELFHLTAISALWSVMTGQHGLAGDSEFMEMLNIVRKFGSNINIFTLYMPTFSKLFPNLTGWKDMLYAGTELFSYSDKTVKSQRKMFKTEDEAD